MAEINYQTLEADGAKTRRYEWESLGDDDQGLPILLSERGDGSIQVRGTFGGATATLQGSNDGVNWFTLNDPAGAPVTLTAPGLVQFIERPWKVRLTTSGGSGTNIDAFLLLGS